MEGRRDLGQLGGFPGMDLQFPGMLCPGTEGEATIPSCAPKGTAQNTGTGTGSMFQGRDERPCSDMQGWRLGNQEALPALELLSTIS